jgi:hypothetical protein
MINTLGNLLKTILQSIYSVLKAILYTMIEARERQSNHELARLLMLNADFKHLGYYEIYSMISNKEKFYKPYHMKNK